MTQTLNESTVNIISEGTRLEGTVTFEDVTRVHGTLIGDVYSLPGSTLILSETGIIEGSVDADTIMIDGFVKGDIKAKTRVVLKEGGRVVGNIQTASLVVAYGAFFEGKCTMPATSAASEKSS